MSKTRKVIALVLVMVIIFCIIFLLGWYRFLVAVISHENLIVEEICNPDRNYCIYVRRFTPFGFDAVEETLMYWNEVSAESGNHDNAAITCDPGDKVEVSWTGSTIVIQSNGRGCVVTGEIPQGVNVQPKQPLR